MNRQLYYLYFKIAVNHQFSLVHSDTLVACCVPYMTPGFWRTSLPVLLVSLLLSLFDVPQSQNPLLRPLPLPKDAFNIPAQVPHLLIYFPKYEEWSPPRLLPAPVLVFGPDLVNPSPICSPCAPRLFHIRKEATGPSGTKSSLPSTYALSHLGLMYFVLLRVLKKLAPMLFILPMDPTSSICLKVAQLCTELSRLVNLLESDMPLRICLES